MILIRRYERGKGGVQSKSNAGLVRCERCHSSKRARSLPVGGRGVTTPAAVYILFTQGVGVVVLPPVNGGSARVPL